MLIQVPFISCSSLSKPGNCAIAVALSSDMRRFAVAVARRETLPIIAHVAEGDMGEHGLALYGAIYRGAAATGTRRVHTRGIELPDSWLPPLIKVTPKEPAPVPYAVGPVARGLALDACELAAAAAGGLPTLAESAARGERLRAHIARIRGMFW